ncbi:MAG: hypothetical protein KAY32_07065 [Candidatus Eisenbacteria sp.]|nr:hypothetical protein [Candidatus Eisenbacteria bacterium]
MRRSESTILLACVLALLCGGCSDSTSPRGDTGPGPEAPDLSSPANVMAALDYAYETREIAIVDSILSDDFVFVFSAEDQARPWFPDSLTRAQEVSAHDALFDVDSVQTLTLDFDVGEAAIDTTRSSPGDTLWTILATNVHIRLYGTVPGCGYEGPLEYKVDGGIGLFWLRETSPDRDTGTPTWEIVRWEDDRIVPARPQGCGQLSAGSENTWGRIKYLFLNGCYRSEH